MLLVFFVLGAWDGNIEGGATKRILDIPNLNYVNSLHKTHVKKVIPLQAVKYLAKKDKP